MIALHICAPNDVNGNPRRCYAVLDGEGFIRDVVDEGYGGEGAMRELRESLGEAIPVVPTEVRVSASEYRRWLAVGDEVSKQRGEATE